MEMLIGFIAGLWIVATIWSNVTTMVVVLKSELNEHIKFNLGLLVFLATLFIIEAVIELSLLLVDKL